MSRLTMSVRIASVKTDPSTAMNPVIGLERKPTGYAAEVVAPDASAANEVWTAELSLRPTPDGILRPCYQFSMAIDDETVALAGAAAHARVPVVAYEEDAADQLWIAATAWSGGTTQSFACYAGTESRVLDLRDGATSAGTHVQIAPASAADGPDVADQQWCLQEVPGSEDDGPVLYKFDATRQWDVWATGGYNQVGHAFLKDGQAKPGLSWKRHN
jgi:hypothetical protein